MEVENDIQKRILGSIKLQLQGEEMLATVLQDTLHLSQDAVYRRMRGDVALTIYETKKLCEEFGLSFDEYGEIRKGIVQFKYNPRGSINWRFESWMEGLRDGLVMVKNLENVKMIVSVDDTPLFHLFNRPHLLRFKVFFWAKTYLRLPEYKDQKFKVDRLDKKITELAIESLNIYNSIPSVEVYGPETLRGLLRQIEYYFDLNYFEDQAYALKLLDNCYSLMEHIKAEATVGRKYTRGNEVPTSGNEFKMYSNDTFLPDNTYLTKWDGGSLVYFTHNMMNYLYSHDPHYVEESEFMLNKLIDNSCLISVENVKQRERFFAKIERSILDFRRKMEMGIEI
ncbi:hypothetical protein JYT74_03340 [Crocinitomix catalasitica]|nr:hypothetical protein [Crocinitomix catalasitica]